MRFAHSLTSHPINSHDFLNSTWYIMSLSIPNPTETSVMKIAQKWGFAHMGRFSQYYTELFGENPSVTLKTAIPQIDGMQDSLCRKTRGDTLILPLYGKVHSLLFTFVLQCHKLL